MTRNVSQMWKDYAASIGKTVGQLTDAEKRQAEVNGVIQETRFQVGDLAKLQGSLSGQMSKVAAETNLAAAALGDAFEPAGAGVAAVTADILKGIREVISVNPAFVAGVTAGAAALTGLTAAGAGWNLVWPKVVVGLQALKGGAGIALIGISALTAIVVGYATATAKAKEETVKLARETKESVRSIYNLTEEYKKLKEKTKLTADEKERLKTVTEDLADLAPTAVKGYNDEEGAIIDLNVALQVMVEKKREALELDKKQAESDLKKARAELKNLKLAKKNTEEGLQGYLAYNPRNPDKRVMEENKKLAKLGVDIQKKQNEIKGLEKRLSIIPEEIKNTTVDTLKAQIKAEQEAERARRDAERNSNTGGGEKSKLTPFELAKKEFERQAFYQNMSLEQEQEYWRKYVAVKAKGVEEIYESDKWLSDNQKQIDENNKKSSEERIQAEEDRRKKTLANLEETIQHEIELGRATSQDLIGFYEKVLETQNLSEEEYIQYYRKLESLKKEVAEKNKARLKEQKDLIDEWQQKADDVSRTALERRLAQIEREREEAKEAATDIIQDQTKLKQTLADIDEVYDDQRLQAIVESLNEEYKLKEDMTAEEMKLVKKLLEAKLQALEVDATASKEQIEAYKRVIQQISDDIDIETAKTNANLKESTSDLLADLVTKKTTIEDVWKDLMDELLRQFIKKFIFGIETESGKLTKIFDNIFNGNIFKGSSSGGGIFNNIFGAISSIFSFSGGGIVPKNILAAANGMIVPQLPSSFGTDMVLSALTPEEMVLPVDISKYIIDSMRQSKYSDVKQDIHFHFNCIDGENAAKFIYENRDSIVGLIHSNRKNGGILRGDVD